MIIIFRRQQETPAFRRPATLQVVCVQATLEAGRKAQFDTILDWGLESPQNPRTGMSALRVAQASQPAGSGDFPVARSCQLIFAYSRTVPSYTPGRKLIVRHAGIAAGWPRVRRQSAIRRVAGD
jgi:hypothetical protein